MKFAAPLSFFAAVAVALAAPAVAEAQQIVGYGPQGPMVLVSPDGRVLHAIPEYGSVSVYFDRQGRRVLVDNRGDMVAREVPLSSVMVPPPGPDIVRLPRSGYSVERLDLPPPAPRNEASLDYPGLDTGAIPVIPAPPTGPQDMPPPIDGRSHDVVMPGASKKEVAALQVLLDRAGASPGVIDGRIGDNVKKALDAYAEETGHRLDPSDKAAIKAELERTGGPAMMEYTITPEDAAGPYVAAIPSDYAEKAQMSRLSYTSTAEMLAERFHMDESYMKAINPGVDFSVPGTVITVANPGSNKEGDVSYIVADKSLEQVRAYSADGQLIAAYPATIGSTDTPSPSGTVKVERIAKNPNYTYNPKINFTQGDNDKILTIPPGPNGPVGNMWIALSKPTYGIHGTPEPSMIGKSNSHGCVRLTNWDANELAKMIEPGVTVEFMD